MSNQYVARFIGSQTEDGGQMVIHARNAEEALRRALHNAEEGDWVSGEKINVVVSLGGEDIAEGETVAP